MNIDSKKRVFQNTLRKNYCLEISEDRTEEVIYELFCFPECEKFYCYLKGPEEKKEEEEAKINVNNEIEIYGSCHYISTRSPEKPA